MIVNTYHSTETGMTVGKLRIIVLKQAWKLVRSLS